MPDDTRPAPPRPAAEPAPSTAASDPADGQTPPLDTVPPPRFSPPLPDPVEPHVLPPAPAGYELLAEVGRGGMGAVYRARDAGLSRDVAVKLLLARFPAEGPAARRFLEEARITGQLQHPGIPAVHQVGTLPDGRPFLAMKLIKGRTLDAQLKERADLLADRGRFVGVFEQVCQAVGYAHSRGVIHRDLKPANVMVGAFGEVQVMDWGLAKVLTEGRTTSVPSEPDETLATEIRTARDADSETRAGSVMGTPAFMPREQAIGAVDQVDARSDVFGLGAILCVILTGQPPYVAATAEAARQLAAQGKLGDAFARLDACGAEPELIALAKRCLAVEKADRPADAGAVATAVADLRAAADDRARRAELDRVRAEGERAKAEAEAREQRKRRRVVAAAAGAVAAVLAAGAGVSAWQMVRANGEADRATNEATNARIAEGKAKEKEAEANAVAEFFADRVFVAARPKSQDGGLGKDVALRDAITASLPALAASFGDQPLVEARLRTVLGSTFIYLGDTRTAAEQLERARAIHTRVLPPDHPATLASITVLAISYAALDRYTDAIALFEQVLAARKRTLPPDDPETLSSMDNLACSYAEQNRFADALPLFEQALAGRKRVRGPDHKETLQSLANLAACYEVMGRSADALPLHEQALAGRKRVRGSDHMETLESLENLASCYDALGRHREACGLREQVLATYKRMLPQDHNYTLTSMSNLANSYTALGRHADALAMLEQALAAQKRVLPPGHQDTLTTMWGVAVCLTRLGRGAEAVPVIDDCVRAAAGRVVNPRMIPELMAQRLGHFQKVGDPAGCRATAVLWEELNRSDHGSLYNAAYFRAVAAGLFARADKPAEAAADADRAMAWLGKAVAAGYKDRAHMEKDPDLDALRGRADFRSLVGSLPSGAPPPPAK